MSAIIILVETEWEEGSQSLRSPGMCLWFGEQLTLAPSLQPVVTGPCSPCPERFLTLLLELLGEGAAEGVAFTQGDEAVEAFALHRMRVTDHSCFCNSLMFH